MDWIFDAVSGLLGQFGVTEWARELLHTDVAKMTIAFTIAAQLHRRWVKKDVAEAFGKLEAAINNVAKTVSQDFAAHTKRLESIENGVAGLDSRVKVLEHK